ncbi:MAG: hypothetical protein AB8G95_03660 [Anaerolineae bacterium]
MITKKWLGIGLASLGTVGIIGSFANDLLNLSEYQGIGPSQRMAILAAGLLILVGVSLIPLGNKPT